MHLCLTALKALLVLLTYIASAQPRVHPLFFFNWIMFCTTSLSLGVYHMSAVAAHL
ncbi:uncharacterized protein B0J16DRAFT_346915 [Fusarium flagelliforme]|uniref:uncharacterized protein n=1 Tax=Fusarium flagelliforme TaxID=2675880 RepID=UPI001E8D37E1|nr:uncharacterized protein B0J16DRAFT_346915 [Fusarium flagelliforme]KAH7179434.1 hypothetical protein B0J16DRAFT_346915 [Fusarium flagelliforme]